MSFPSDRCSCAGNHTRFRERFEFDLVTSDPRNAEQSACEFISKQKGIVGAESKDDFWAEGGAGIYACGKGARARLQPLRWFSGRSLITGSFYLALS
jgi:hypothetical protein